MVQPQDSQDTESQPTKAVVLGGRSVVGPDLLRRLAEASHQGVVTGRESAPADLTLPKSFAWTRLDPRQPGDWQAPPDSLVFSLIPLPALEPLLPALRPARHIVALSTTGVFYRAESEDARERAYIADLRRCEQALAETCAESGTAWTLLRPTLVYAPGRDKNVSAVAKVIRRFGLFPIAAPGSGLRQPVHADDVAQAALAATRNAAAANREFVVSGGETLDYRAMVERVFEALGRKPRVLPLPTGLLAFAMRVAGPLRGKVYSPALFERMNRDLAFESGEAREVLGFDPRPFQPDFSNID